MPADPRQPCDGHAVGCQCDIEAADRVRDPSQIAGSGDPLRQRRRQRRPVLGPVDLGRTGEVIQATVRAGFELTLEKAEAATRLARAHNDGELEQQITSLREGAWRYRETDLWRELVQRSDGVQVARRPGAAPGRLGLTVRDDPGGVDPNVTDPSVTEPQ